MAVVQRKTEQKTDAALPLIPLLRRLWMHVRPYYRHRFYVVFLLTGICAFAEIISLGAVLPFLSVLLEPEKVMQHALVLRYASGWGIEDVASLRVALTALFIGATIVAGMLRILLLWMSTRVAYACGSELSVELYRRTLYQPYVVHVQRNSSTILSGIGKVSGAINILMQCVVLFSSGIIITAIVGTLIFLNPWIAVISMLVCGGSYIGITLWARQRLYRNSGLIAGEQTKVFKAVQEGLGGIRDVLLDGLQHIYCNIYQQADTRLRKGQGDNLFIGGSPRFVMETTGMVLIAGLAYYLCTTAGNLNEALPMLGALALGAQRLLPTLQQAYSAWAAIAGSRAGLADTVELLEQPLDTSSIAAVSALPFSRSVAFDAVSFCYGTAETTRVLEQVSFTIAKGERIGITGSTGSGKSTCMDVLMGLLRPSQGRILVDGQEITADNVAMWQKNIAHVPQHIFLTDSSIAANIAFGVVPEAIDMERVRWAAQQAQIAEYIEQQPGQYHASVGERGIRLSGGQRQRIGIARALYKQATVLVFDEATSALDNLTEQSLMEAIDNLDRGLTIFTIAHRLSTVQRCDRIIELDGGRVKAEGTYVALMESSESFRNNARA